MLILTSHMAWVFGFMLDTAVVAAPLPAATAEPLSDAVVAPSIAALVQPIPRPLQRIGGPALASTSRLWKAEYELATGQPFPTFAQVPLPPAPPGVTWTYRYSFWDSHGCLQDVVSNYGATYHLVACCPPPSMEFPCPEQ